MVFLDIIWETAECTHLWLMHLLWCKFIYGLKFPTNLTYLFSIFSIIGSINYGHKKKEIKIKLTRIGSFVASYPSGRICSELIMRFFAWFLSSDTQKFLTFTDQFLHGRQLSFTWFSMLRPCDNRYEVEGRL